jgi:hypothetical protein
MQTAKSIKKTTCFMSMASQMLVWAILLFVSTNLSHTIDPLNFTTKKNQFSQIDVIWATKNIQKICFLFGKYQIYLCDGEKNSVFPLHSPTTKTVMKIFRRDGLRPISDGDRIVPDS